LGCGSGRNFSAISSKNKNKTKIYALDFSQNMLNYAKQKAEKLNIKIQTIKSSSHKLQFKDNFFDSIICIALLHCISKKSKRKNTIKEIYRTLKPKSQALISVWSRNSPRLKNKPKNTYIPWAIEGREGKSKERRYTYIYDKDELEKEIRQAGFNIISIWEERNINIIAEKPTTDSQAMPLKNQKTSNKVKNPKKQVEQVN